MANDGWGASARRDALRAAYLSGAMAARVASMSGGPWNADEFARVMTERAAKLYPDPTRPRVLSLTRSIGDKPMEFRYIKDGETVLLLQWRRAGLVDWQGAGSLNLSNFDADALLALSQLRRNPTEPDE